jgi:lysophospholipase L1-like esterase
VFCYFHSKQASVTETHFRKPISIVLIGDSTMYEYPAISPMRGWGQFLAPLLPSHYQVINQARCGMSSKTYPTALWMATLEQRPRFVVIQFGHNDSHAPHLPESTDAATDFMENMEKFIREARAASSRPILVTPVRRRTFENERPTEELTPYAEAVKAVTARQNTPCIDLHQKSGLLYETVGEEGTREYTVNVMDVADRSGREDRTHFTPVGAQVIAKLVAPELLEILDQSSEPQKP